MSFRLLADENFNANLLNALASEAPEIEVVTIQALDLRGLSDPGVLAHAAETGRIVLSHDVQTMIADAYARVKQGLSMPGVLIVPSDYPAWAFVAYLMLLHGASLPGELERQVRHFPPPSEVTPL